MIVFLEDKSIKTYLDPISLATNEISVGPSLTYQHNKSSHSRGEKTEDNCKSSFLVQSISSLLWLPGLGLLLTSDLSGQTGLLRRCGQLRCPCV